MKTSKASRPFSAGLIVQSFVIAALLSILGCGPKPPKPYPATGTVHVNGKPAERVLLIFYPETALPTEFQVPTPRAMTGSDGQYKITTYSGEDGAPAGEYRISAVWMTKRPDDMDPEAFNARDRLKGKYADPDRSGLRVTIEPGGNVLELLDL